MAKPKKTTAENQNGHASPETAEALRDSVKNDGACAVKSEKTDISKADATNADATNADATKVDADKVDATKADADKIAAEPISDESEALGKQKADGKRKLSSVVDSIAEGEAASDTYRTSPGIPTDTADAKPADVTASDAESKSESEKQLAENDAQEEQNAVEFAALPGEEERIPYTDPRGGRFLAALTLKLLLISSLTALLLSGVNALTASRIAQNAAAEKAAAISAIFPTGNGHTLVNTEYENIDELYLVSTVDGIIGYTASVSPLGFGGEFSIMVGVTANGSVAGIKIVSHSETPGLGSRVGEPAFLSQFIGKGGTLSADKDIDVITGSTVSSDAVLEGVNYALAIFDRLSAEHFAEEGGN